jgi:acylphosphatase
VVSNPDVLKRLKEFVCLRLDHDQMQKHKGRLRVPTQGNQVLLTPKGEYVPDTEPRGKRYPVADFVALLDRVLKDYPPHPERKDELKLAWFWWEPRKQGLPGHFDASAISRLDRKPILSISGPVPEWLDRSDMLHRHVRQFIWTRSGSDEKGTIAIRQLEPERNELLALGLEMTSREEVSQALDRVWLEYMKERPMVARGYIDNPHGNWLKRVMEETHKEEVSVRESAIKGLLSPPGRAEARLADVGPMVYYSGQVQGVGFRATAAEIAKGYKVTGWVKNLDDGRVQLVVEGTDEEVRKFLEAVRNRWKKNIEKAQVEERKPTGEFKGFSVRL